MRRRAYSSIPTPVSSISDAPYYENAWRSGLSADDTEAEAAASTTATATARSASSLEKKRERDRVAQQKKRAKRDQETQALRNRLAVVEEELKGFRLFCETLERENQVLRSRQAGVMQVVASWSGSTSSQEPTEQALSELSLHSAAKSPREPSDHGSSPAGGAGLGAAGQGSQWAPDHSPRDNTPVSLVEHDVAMDSGSSSGFTAHPMREQMSGTANVGSSGTPSTYDNAAGAAAALELTPPPWSLPPLHADADVFPEGQSAQWLLYPDLVRASPEAPKPIEILYGSRHNFLANAISDCSRLWPVSEPERLAWGLVLYDLAKWTKAPSEESYARVAGFLRPVPEQLLHPHSYFIDLIPWPRLRTNLIKYQHLYDHAEVSSLIACCAKVRWPWRKAVLYPNDTTGELELAPDFYETFTRLDGWALSKEFFPCVQKYPGLLEGIDIDEITYQVM
jgi:hypothetical protein